MNIERLEKNILYSFRKKSLATQALSHPSVYNNKANQFQRLEFLGDKILSFIIADALFRHFDFYTEALLTKHHNFLVSTKVLCEISQKIKIQDLLILSKGEEKCEGRTKESNLANALEALIAAIFLDSNLSKTYEVVKHLWKDRLYDQDSFYNFDPKSQLQELSQKYFLQPPSYILEKKEGSEHNPVFFIQVKLNKYIAKGNGKSKKQAEFNAARAFLEQYKNLIKKH